MARLINNDIAVQGMIEKYGRKYQRKQLREMREGGGEARQEAVFCYKPYATH